MVILMMMLCSFGNFITLFLYYYLYLHMKKIHNVCDKIACCDFLIIYGKQKDFQSNLDFWLENYVSYVKYNRNFALIQHWRVPSPHLWSISKSSL